MSVIGSNIIAGASGVVADTGYQIARSLRFNAADTPYLTRTPSVAGNRKTYTINTWVKRSSLGSLQMIMSAGLFTTSNQIAYLCFRANDTIGVEFGVFGVSTEVSASTTAVFRDVGSTYNIQLAVDTTQATASNRLKLYVNGVQYSLSANVATQNYDSAFNATLVHRIGNDPIGEQFAGYLSEPRLIDGQALDQTNFGETDSATGVWVPKAYTGTYGTNGFWLKFDDNSGTTSTTLGKDSSGNSNNWTPNNFSVTAGVGNDSLVDTPTNYGTDTGAGGEVRGNYATLNPLSGLFVGTMSNGNLDFSTAANTNNLRHATVGVESGKWYAEVTINSALSANANFGIAVYGQSAIGVSNGSPSRGYYYDGQKFSNGTLSAYGSSFTNGDVIGVAVDVDSGKIWFSKNGVWQNSGSPTGGTNAAFSDITGTTWFLSLQGGGTTGGASSSWNFGQRPFAYTAPSGFKALCTTNLPTPAIGASASTLASKNFDATLWTGTGASLNVVNDGGFAPDFVWTKPRNTAVGHTLFDTIRGVTKYLQSNTTGAEGTSATSLTAFNSNGFTVNSDTSTGANGSTYVGWQWKAGGTAVSNTAGSITSQVSANAAAGISVIGWTSTGSNGTIGHGLGVAPAFIIARRRNTAENWLVYHKNMGGNNGYLLLNSTAAFATNAAPWNSTDPTSTVFSINNTAMGAGTGNPMITYAFAEVAGFSRFGSYTGNGSADGPFVYCGFRPRWILLKSSSTATYNWIMYDTVRKTFNVCDTMLVPNLSDAEFVNADWNIDILSNGFKVRSSYIQVNNSGTTFIYAAFAESPFNYARAR